MRLRRALVGAVLGGALALGGTAATAQAAEPAPAPKVSASETNVGIMGWRFYAAYWTLDACAAVGDQSGRDYYCERKRGNDGKLKWFLYLWY
ncbi:hypothetical protein ACH4HG_41180 [Streptomyces coeruleorubidus]|uniref:Uncharacterized protein n=1 Tax=Streptomyces coeruleorubidus TaxID=116188 RepID=A0ABZ0K4V8_STRC4|nr:MULTISPECIES: hypothetical protein [Streptomyces]WOT32689.1 hypothetical protein R5U08_00285 [Streptomyces coeruleorubidus]GGU43892.1 hypothetical protein GCM10010244_82500 [Streptomyces bellus]